MGLLALLVLAPTPALADEPDFEARIELLLSEHEAQQGPDYDYVFLGIDLVPGLGRSTAGGTRQVRVFSANLIGGYSAGLAGVEGAGVINIHDDFMRGVQGAGVINVVGGEVNGVQGAGSVNIAGEHMGGVQAAGAVNVAGGYVHGIQAAGAVNVAAGPVRGVQASGGANIAAGDVRGIQAGVFNLSSGTVHGVQLGVVNVADDIEGLGVGLVNIYPHGRFHIDAWMDETAMLSQGIKSGGGWFHNIYALGINPVRPGDVSATLGAGLHWNLPGPLYTDLDFLHRHDKLQGVPWGTLYMTNTLRGVAGMQLAPRLAIFAGPSWNVLTTTCGEPQGRRVRTLNREGKVQTYAWPGLSIGIQLL